jgi:flagellar biosynthetic protein FliP
MTFHDHPSTPLLREEQPIADAQEALPTRRPGAQHEMKRPALSADRAEALFTEQRSVAAARITALAVYRSRRIPAAVLSYLGMVVAMYVGMVALNAGRQVFLPGPVLGGDVEALLMAGEMTVGMGVWMVIRRHPWPSIIVMSAAMVAPFLLLLPAFWAGALAADALMTVGHVLMFATMALAMPLSHRTGGHHDGAHH